MQGVSGGIVVDSPALSQHERAVSAGRSERFPNKEALHLAVFQAYPEQYADELASLNRNRSGK